MFKGADGLQGAGGTGPLSSSIQLGDYNLLVGLGFRVEILYDHVIREDTKNQEIYPFQDPP